MKVIYGIAIASMMTTFVSGILVSDKTGGAIRKDYTDLTVDEEDRIFGGSDADISNYPFAARVHISATDDELFCAGTLIAPRYILTSSDCLDLAPQDMHVSLGTQRIKNKRSRKSEKIRVVEAFRHPKYDYSRSSYLYNLVLFKLEKPSTHKPARLPDVDGSNEEPGTIGVVIGWGLVNENDMAKTLQSVDAEIISDEKCSRYTSDTDLMLCAGSERGKSFCYRDLGGPLVVNGVVVGIATTFGRDDSDCGEEPGLYTRVFQMLDYITNIKNGGSSGNITDVS